MSRLSPRVAVNVLTVLIVSVLVVIGAFLTYVSGVLFDDSYEITVPMPEGGGVQPLQEVTVLGRAVGQVDDVRIVEDGVLLTLSIDGDRRVPEQADVQVLRRSPIGEQAVDVQPLTAGWEAVEPGGTVVPREATVPAPVPFLLEETVDLFEAIEPDDVSILVHELSNALAGRGERLRNLNRDTLELNRTLVGGIPTFERLLDTSEPVLETLREHRDALASSFGSGADLAEVFADQRGNVDDLLDHAPRALDETDVLVRNVRADLACLTRDMTALNEMLLGPSTYAGENPDLYDSKLDELERMLVSNRYFFDLGFNIISQPDPLTGLSNREVLQDRLEQAQSRAARSRRPVAVLLCDLDDFKDVNDTHGHAVGDQLLVAIAQRMRTAARSSDTVARLGVDEFAILCEGIDGHRAAIEIARRILAATEDRVDIDGRSLHAGVSIGIAVDDGQRSGQELLRDADIALYEAKADGKQRWSIHRRRMTERAHARLQLATDLARAVDTGRIELLFSLMTAAVVVASVRVLGVLLISAAVVLPASIARLFSRSFGSSLVAATVIGLLTSVVGLFASFHINVPSGPTIVLAGTAVFGVLFVATAVVAWGRVARVRRRGSLAADV